MPRFVPRIQPVLTFAVLLVLTACGGLGGPTRCVDAFVASLLG